MAQERIAKAGTGSILERQMFDPYFYSDFYAHVLLLLTLVSAVLYARGQSGAEASEQYNSVMTWVMIVAVSLFIGTRPISSAFVDMRTYELIFNNASATGEVIFNDWAFAAMMVFFSAYFSAGWFFFASTVVYVVPLAALSRVHGRWAFAAILACMGSFSFFAYSVNTIRQGMAASLLIAAFANYKRRWVMFALMALSFGMHKSMLAPMAAFILAAFVGIPWLAWITWAGALLLSVTIGQSLSNYITSISYFAEDDKFLRYAQGVGQDKGGFRWDFIVYSILPVLITFVLARPDVRRDPLYRRLLTTFLLTNAFWLCVIYAAYSDRFAYLSWFLLPWLVTYPFLPKAEPVGLGQSTQELRLGWLAAALLAHYGFTYFMKMVYYAGYVY